MRHDDLAAFVLLRYHCRPDTKLDGRSEDGEDQFHVGEGGWDRSVRVGFDDLLISPTLSFMCPTSASVVLRPPLDSLARLA